MKRLSSVFLVIFLLASLPGSYTRAQSVPLNPTPLQESPELDLTIAAEPGLFGAMAVQGDYLYSSQGEYLQVFSFLQPRDPNLAARLYLSSRINDIALAGETAYVTAEDALHILDIGDPLRPEEVGTFHVAGAGLGQMVHQGQNLFVSSYFTATITSSILVLDVSNPFTPFEVGRTSQLDYHESIAVGDNLLYAESDHLGISIFDISAPGDPEFITNFDLSSLKNMYITGMQAVGSTLYVGSAFWGLDIIDVSNPENPKIVGTYDEALGSDASALAIQGNYAYLLADVAELRVVDISNPAQPVRVNTTSLPSSNGSLMISGNYLYVSLFGVGLSTFDISDAALPRQTGEYATVGAGERIILDGNLGYVLEVDDYSDQSNLKILDLTRPTQPIVLSGFPIPYTAVEFAVKDNFVYVALEYDGLLVLDASIPTQLKSMGIYQTSTPSQPAQDLAITGSILAFVHGYPDYGLFTLDLFDISSPVSPTIVSHLTLASAFHDVQAVGNLIYILADNTLTIIDITNPAEPQVVEERPFAGDELLVNMPFGYTLDTDDIPGTFSVLDLSKPLDPLPLAQISLTSERMAYQEGYIYFISVRDLLKIVNVSAPDHPVDLGSYLTTGNDIAAQGNFIYLLRDFTGLTIFWFSPPTSILLQAEGGELQSEPDGISYIFPEGAFTTTVELTHTPRLFTTTPPLPDDLLYINRTFEVNAVITGTQTSADPTLPYTLTIPYNPEDLGVVREDTLALYAWNGSEWVEEETAHLNMETNQLTTAPTHTGLFAVAGQTRRTYLPVIQRTP